jgi:hypothetical protein
MSADNWAICPKCLADAKAAADKERAEVYAKYGKVPMIAFDKLRDDLVDVAPEDHRTFREDYEVYGAEEGTVHFSYSGYCETCRLGLNFQIDKDLSL